MERICNLAHHHSYTSRFSCCNTRVSLMTGSASGDPGQHWKWASGTEFKHRSERWDPLPGTGEKTEASKGHRKPRESESPGIKVPIQSMVFGVQQSYECKHPGSALEGVGQVSFEDEDGKISHGAITV